MKKRNLFLILAIILLLSAASFCLWQLTRQPTGNYQVIGTEDNCALIRVDASSDSLFNRTLWVCIDEKETTDEATLWLPYDESEIHRIPEGSWYLHISDEFDHRLTIPLIDQVLSVRITTEPDVLYPIGSEIPLSYEISSIGTSEEVTFHSSDESIARIQNDRILTCGKGTARITADVSDLSDSITIRVSDLYTLPDSDSENKPFLRELVCDEEEAHLLDEVLAEKIAAAGYRSRAAVTEAARFLTLQFPYKLAYFSESGRLDTTTGSRSSDGEGRYYHEGLFLSEDKFDLLGPGVFGRACWGQFFEEDDSDDHSLDDWYLHDGFVPADIGSHLYLSKRPNGFDCSGFVAWCYYNGGYDFGDMGAGGPESYGMAQLGQRVPISDELLQSDRIRCGDLVGFSSHVGIVIGVEEDGIWIADTLPATGLKVKRYERNVESFDELGSYAWQYFMLMDEEYENDGNYTAMW